VREKDSKGLNPNGSLIRVKCTMPFISKRSHRARRGEHKDRQLMLYKISSICLISKANIESVVASLATAPTGGIKITLSNPTTVTGEAVRGGRREEGGGEEREMRLQRVLGCRALIE